MAKKGGSGSGALDYFGSIAGLVCAGPVDELVAVIVDSKTVWPDASRGFWEEGGEYIAGDSVLGSGRVWTCLAAHTAAPENAPGTGTEWTELLLRRSDVGVGNPAILQIVGYGTLILYWGTADQELDVASEPTFAATHPPYRRQCFVVLKDFLFGRERTSAPNVEIVVRRHPVQSVVSGTAGQLDPQGQANPVAALADLMTDPVHGLGLSLGRFDLGKWGSSAASIESDASVSYLSPVLSSATQARGVLADIVPYYDGWFRWSSTGKVEAGAFLRGQPGLQYPKIDADNLTDEVSYKAEAHPDTVNEVTVRFVDRFRAFKQGAQKAVTGDRDEPREETLERPWIARADQAARYAAEWVQMFADPGVSGSVTAIGSKVTGILPGALFWLTHDALGFETLCRCEGISHAAPPADRVSITFTSDRSLHPTPVHSAATGPQTIAPPAPEVITLNRLVQPPQALTGTGDYRLVVLAARRAPSTAGLRVHMQAEDPSLFVELGSQATWAVTGLLTQDYSIDGPDDDDSESLRLELDPDTLDVDRTRISATQSADAVADDTILVWVFDGSGQFEVMALKAIRLEGIYRLKVARGRLGTAKRGFLTGHRAWIQARTDTVAYTHGSFAGLSQAETSATFRLQPRNIWREADVADPDQCPDIAYTFNSWHSPPSHFDYDFGVI